MEVEDLPRHRDLRTAADRLGTDPLDWLPGANDDCELLFTCGPGEVNTLAERVSAVAGVPVTRIGEVLGESGVWLED